MKALEEWGYRVIAVASDRCYMNGKDELIGLGFQCIDVPFERSPIRKSNASAYKDLRTMFASKDDIKLVHVHTATAAFITRIAAAAAHSNAAMLYTSHGFYFHEGSKAKDWLMYYWPEKYAARQTDGLITINHEDYEVAKKFAVRPGGRVYYVPGVGVDLSLYMPGSHDDRCEIRARLGAGPEDVVFIYVAEVNRNKNQRQFLTAFRDMCHSTKVPARAWIVGDGPLKPDMQALAYDMRIDSRVSFLGFRRDVPALLRGADVAVLLSYREGLPRCLMEACATGLPVIATNTRGNRDIVDNEVNGILVQPDDVEATTNALCTLAMDDRIRRSMANQGREKIQSFGIDKVMPLMSEIYRSWLDER